MALSPFPAPLTAAKRARESPEGLWKESCPTRNRQGHGHGACRAGCCCPEGLRPREVQTTSSPSSSSSCDWRHRLESHRQFMCRYLLYPECKHTENSFFLYATTGKSWTPPLVSVSVVQRTEMLGELRRTVGSVLGINVLVQGQKLRKI